MDLSFVVLTWVIESMEQEPIRTNAALSREKSLEIDMVIYTPLSRVTQTVL